MNVESVKHNLQQLLASVRQRFSGYEERPQQIEMIRAILNGIYSQRHVMVEAGTGTGKSLAYLVALLAVILSEKAKKRIVISTHTINLQEQLLKKDIPAVLKAIGKDGEFSAALAKGRGNYLCLRRFFEVLRSTEGVFHSAEEVLNFHELRAQIYNGREVLCGDKAELKLRVLPGVWSEVNCSQDTCLESNCPQYFDCYFRKARSSLEKADIIVSNHALFLTDLAIRRSSENEEGILPPYDFVVLDEAHHVEDVAADAFSVRIEQQSLQRLVSWAQRAGTSLTVRTAASDGEVVARQIVTCCQHCYHAISTLQQGFGALLPANCTTMRLRAEDLERLDNPLRNPLAELVHWFKKLESTEDLPDEVMAEITKVRQRLQAAADDIDFFVEGKGREHVYWLERRGAEIEAVAAPLNVAEVLGTSLFDKSVPVVLTSATLAVPTMSFMAKRLGVGSYYHKIIHSPFDYQRNARLVVPQNAIEPDYSDIGRYERYCADLLVELRKKIRGGIFALFTSYSLLAAVAELVEDELIDLGSMVLKQGDLPRHELIQEFKQQGTAVLLGTASFWEGVDVVGDALRCVFITKLPFAVPDHPLTEARMERLRQRGENPFMSYLLPQAVLQFKQGFGRLIRSTKDRGLVVVADRRILTKSYGRTFLASLPPIPVIDEIVDID